MTVDSGQLTVYGGQIDGVWWTVDGVRWTNRRCTVNKSTVYGG
ncbi:hypothetical protein [Plectonema radiosum]|nr:hypothetical protein [Plectonema radiosum]